jgi:sugar phosphate isomerase/epimerase
MSIPIALQLYSVHQDCANDFFGTIEKVAKMGYDGVEFAGFHGKSAEEIKKVLDQLGLKVAGSHTGYQTLEDDQFEATVKFHKTIGCENLIIPWIPEEMRNTPEVCKKTAEWFTELAKKVAAVGLKTGFHAHSGDMKPLAGGKSAWDLLAAGTPKEFLLQYDTANGVDGGAHAVQPILDWPGRSASVHLKEWKGGHGLAPVGEGDIPWAEVFKACETVGGTVWYIVEHENETETPAIVQVERCIQNLRKMGK